MATSNTKSSKSSEIAIPGLVTPYIRFMLADEPKDAAKAAAKTDEAFRSERWIAEEKLDGHRFQCHIGKTNRFFSRQMSKKDGLPVEKSDNIPHIKKAQFKGLEGTILDGEVIANDETWRSTQKIMGALPEKAVKTQETLGKINYHVYDILWHKGESVMDKPFEERRKLLESLILPQHVRLVRQKRLFKKEFYEEIVDRCGEGIILKNLDEPYLPQKRRANIWLKVKHMSTYDVVVMGYNRPDEFSTNTKGEKVTNKHFAEDKIATVKFGVYKDNRLEYLGKADGFDEDLRRKISDNPIDYLDVVMEVRADGRGILKDGLRWAKYVRFRPDANIEECTWERVISQVPTEKKNKEE
jgi:ATP-dependent DNA ligase